MESSKRDWRFWILLLGGIGLAMGILISLINVIGSFFSISGILWFDSLKGVAVLLPALIIYTIFAVKYMCRVTKKPKNT